MTDSTSTKPGEDSYLDTAQKTMQDASQKVTDSTKDASQKVNDSTSTKPGEEGYLETAQKTVQDAVEYVEKTATGMSSFMIILGSSEEKIITMH